MLSARFLLVVVVAALIVATASAHARKEHHPIENRLAHPLASCKQVEHVEQFNDEDGDYRDAPTNGPFVYERFGIGYVNLARVKMDEHFHEHMVPAPEGDEAHNVAAVGAFTKPSGFALNGTIGYFAIRPSSLVHAFTVKSISFFCLRDRRPEACTMGFDYAEYQQDGPLQWHTAQIDDPVASISYAPSWGSPSVHVVFKEFHALQMFSFGLPLYKEQHWHDSTSAEDKLDPLLNKDDITAYIESIEFVTWQCEDELPKNPTSGAMRRVLEGELGQF